MVIDAISLLFLAFIGILGSKAIHAFRQSKQAVEESASLISVIVDALSTRLGQSEHIVNQLHSDVEGAKKQSAALEGEQAILRSSHLQLLRHLQEILADDRRLIEELEQLETRVSVVQHTVSTGEPIAKPEAPKREGLATVIKNGDILASLTPTERQTLQILSREGPKAAPELGKRLKKSREHTSRLMKKLYLDGYVDRESNRAPFRYRLNETVRSALGSEDKTVRAEPVSEEV